MDGHHETPLHVLALRLLQIPDSKEVYIEMHLPNGQILRRVLPDARLAAT